MITIDKSFLKRSFPYLVIVLLLLFYFQCERPKSQGALAEYEKEKKVAQKTIDSLKSSNAKLSDNEKLLKDSLETVNSKAKMSEWMLAEVRKKSATKLKEAKKYNPTQVQQFLQERYAEYGKVESTENGITATDSVPNKMVETCVELDNTKNELAATNEVLDNEKAKNEVLTNLAENVTQQRDNQIKITGEVTGLLDKSEQVAKEQEKDIKSLTRKNNIKNILIPASIIIGFLTGAAISN